MLEEKRQRNGKKWKKPPQRVVGRPCEYKEEYIEAVEKYLKTCQDQEDEFHKLRSAKADGYDRLVRVQLPTFEGFAHFIGVNTSSLYEWDKKFPEFSNELVRIKEEQKKRLLNKGLSGDYNPIIAKLILSAHHGLTERTDITTNGKELPTPIIDVSTNNGD